MSHKPKPRTLNPQPQALNPKSYTLAIDTSPRVGAAVRAGAPHREDGRHPIHAKGT